MKELYCRYTTMRIPQLTYKNTRVIFTSKDEFKYHKKYKY